MHQLEASFRSMFKSCCPHALLSRFCRAPVSQNSFKRHLPPSPMVHCCHWLFMLRQLAAQCPPQEQIRFRKTAKWASAARTPDKCLSTVLSMEPSLQIMGSFFKAAKRYSSESASSSLLKLLDQQVSPVTQALGRYSAILNDEAHPHWRGFSFGRLWTPKLYQTAAVPMLVEIGSLFRRFDTDLDVWPWRLGKLCLDETSEADKRAIGFQLKCCSAECCLTPEDTISRDFKALVQEDGSMDRGDLQRLADVFLCTPLTNIRSELHFASARVSGGKTATNTATAVFRETKQAPWQFTFKLETPQWG